MQDLETWLPAAGPAPTAARPLLFYPAWEILPHEGKLPHADVISERLQTLVALSAGSTAPAPATGRHLRRGAAAKNLCAGRFGRPRTRSCSGATGSRRWI